MIQETASSNTHGDLSKLASLIAAYAPHDGSFDLRLDGVRVYRASLPQKGLSHVLYRSVLCIVAQGAKRVFFGDESFEYDASHLLISSVDLPVSTQVTRASQAKPFLGVVLDLDPQKIAELALRVYPHGLPQVRKDGALYIGHSDQGIIQAAIRLIELMDHPEDAAQIAPLAVDEILIRLLRGPDGARLAQIGQKESKLQRVSKAVTWVRSNFDVTLDVERLATMVHMSVSSFHRHFKSVTSMSPLQYQKLLRLQEARRLMMSKMMDAGSAARMVGYLSASQFSREYGRYFGNPPTKDIAMMREGSTANSGR